MPSPLPRLLDLHQCPNPFIRHQRTIQGLCFCLIGGSEEDIPAEPSADIFKDRDDVGGFGLGHCPFAFKCRSGTNSERTGC